MPSRQSQLSQSVAEEISDSIRQYHRWWRIWGLVASMATVLSILASFVAGVLAATKSLTTTWLAVAIAGLPAVLLTLAQSFRFRERSDWFWDLVLQYQELQRAIKRGEIDDKDASRRIDAIERLANSIDPSKATSIHGAPRSETLACPSCATPNAKSNKHCAECGMKLSPA
jgi:hypothetical protein